MNRKLKGLTLLADLVIVCLCIGIIIGIIILGCNIVGDIIEKSDRIDDVGYKYKIYITVADHEYYYYTDSFKVTNNGNAIKFTDKTTEKRILPVNTLSNSINERR